MRVAGRVIHDLVPGIAERLYGFGVFVHPVADDKKVVFMPYLFRMSISVCKNSIMLSPSSFFLANPLRWALLGVCEVSRAFRLDGLRHIFVSKAKNHSKIHRCQVQAVLTRQKSGQTTKRPQGILCVLARSLRTYGRSFCPSKPCVSLSIEGTQSRTEEAFKGMEEVL